MMNIGIPSIIIKMLRQKFDQQWSVRKSVSTESEQARVLELLRPVDVHMDARLQGPTIDVQQLLQLETGDVLAFDHDVGKVLRLLVNGVERYTGHVVAAGRKRAFMVNDLTR